MVNQQPETQVTPTRNPFLVGFVIGFLAGNAILIGLMVGVVLGVLTGGSYHYAVTRKG